MSMDIPANYTDNWLIIIFVVLVSWAASKNPRKYFIFNNGEF